MYAFASRLVAAELNRSMKNSCRNEQVLPLEELYTILYPLVYPLLSAPIGPGHDLQLVTCFASWMQ